MKFDTSRAEQLSASFGFPRASGSEGERRAATLVARELERAGYRVEETEVEGRLWGWEFRFALSRFLGFGLILPLGLFPPFAGTFWARLGAFLAVLVFFGLPPWGSRWKPKLGRVLRSPNVKAVRITDHDPLFRVVFLTSLDSPRRPFSRGFRKVSLWILGFLAIEVVVLELGYQSRLPGLTPFALLALVLALELGLIFWLISEARLSFAEDDRDNRDGLATLLELARSWSPRIGNQVETWFVTAGGHALDNAGLREVYRLIREEGRTKPTVLIGLWSPGLGPPYAIRSNGFIAWEHAREAADSLRIPRRDGNNPFLTGGFWSMGMTEPEIVALIGDVEENLPASIRANSMDLAAQLASEIVLRWIKDQKPPESDDQPGESLARSSQNLG